MAYSDDLKNPKWQKKRLEIMERDQFQCKCCLSKDKELTVHHKEYISGRKPWEYEDKVFITMCIECHDWFHKLQKLGKLPLNIPERNETENFIFAYHICQLYNDYGANGIKQLDDMAVAMTIKQDEI
jgi:5-methylcytosine-specific restriction endonuclease McrA